MTSATDAGPTPGATATTTAGADAALQAQRTAERSRDAMFAGDHAVKALGMSIEAVGPGTSSVRMPVRADMVNGHDVCHGGLIATLADTAFAYACNAYNEATVASGFAIDLLRPGKAGDVLTAHAREVSRGGRSGIYDVEVLNQRGERVAVFRGRSHTFKGRPVFEPDAPAA